MFSATGLNDKIFVKRMIDLKTDATQGISKFDQTFLTRTASTIVLLWRFDWLLLLVAWRPAFDWCLRNWLLLLLNWCLWSLTFSFALVVLLLWNRLFLLLLRNVLNLLLNWWRWRWFGCWTLLSWRFSSTFSTTTTTAHVSEREKVFD